MKLMAFNGSPRKKWNTATLLQHAVDGAEQAGAEVELIHLYDLTFKGCASCFSCKRHGRKVKGVCVLKDDLKPVLERVREADGLLLGTPVYYGREAAAMCAFLERLQFPFLNYDDYAHSHFPRRIPTGLIYTMNMPEDRLEAMGYSATFERTRRYLERHFGSCTLMLATNTTQFSDYDKYESSYDKEVKAAYRAQHFPEDCRRAEVLGARLARGVEG